MLEENMLEENNGRYKLGKKIGTGGMANVFEGFDNKLNKNVAIKILKDSDCCDITSKRRFFNEAQIIAKLKHPNIVEIFDIYLEDDKLCIVLEYIKGETLKEYIKKNKRISLEIAINIIVEICSALAKAHNNEPSIIHRDIKPANIILSFDNKNYVIYVKLCDFGIAKIANKTRVTAFNTIIGTCEYISPEQINGGEGSNTSDIYSLGVVFYEMITGELPFKSSNNIGYLTQHSKDKPKKPSEVFKEIPTEIDNIIMKMLEKNIIDRYQSVEELLVDLKEFGKKKFGMIFKEENFVKLLKSAIKTNKKGDTIRLPDEVKSPTLLYKQDVLEVDKLEFKHIIGGIFDMGSPPDEFARFDDETLHKVELSNFYISKYMVTVKQYMEFVEDSKYNYNFKDYDWSYYKEKNFEKNPISYINWFDAKAYCNWLSKKHNMYNFRLPTEAEFEYAARAGTITPFYTGENITTDEANYNGNYPYNIYPKGKYIGKIMPNGSYKPNNWDLYDMAGNLYSWCEDFYNDNYYDECKKMGIIKDPKGGKEGSYRVLRGGYWDSRAQRCRSAFRRYRLPEYRDYSYGIRLVCVP